MFLLVSVRYVGAHPDEHQHGVSIQISVNLGKTFLRISRVRNITLTWILARVFAYLPLFMSQILNFIYWTVLIFILIYFEWRDTENQQFVWRIVLRDNWNRVKCQLSFFAPPECAQVTADRSAEGSPFDRNQTNSILLLTYSIGPLCWCGK